MKSLKYLSNTNFFAFDTTAEKCSIAGRNFSCRSHRNIADLSKGNDPSAMFSSEDIS